MNGSNKKEWPEIPPGLKYMDVRIPGTFREVVANKAFDDSQIGRIVRCLLLDTDYFIGHDIEVEVKYYRQCLVTRNNTRMRIQEYRKRKKYGAAGILSAAIEAGNSHLKANEGSVTVTDPSAQAHVDTSSDEKTPSNLKEKHPPIVPPKKKEPSSLEKCMKVGDKDSVATVIQADLFSAPFGCGDKGKIAGSTESGSIGVQDSGKAIGGATAPQDIESVPGRSMGPSGGCDKNVDASLVVDSRNDLAWIPYRFTMFWERYPRKVAKADAVKAFTKLIKSQRDVDKFMSTLISSLEWWKRQQTWTKDNGRYIPYPATWLNRGCWEDSKDNKSNSGDSEGAQYLSLDSESNDDLIRRMRGG